MLNKASGLNQSEKSRNMGRRFLIISILILIVAFVLFYELSFSKYKKSTDDGQKISNVEIIKADEKENKEEHSCCADEEAEAYSDNSIYQLESDLPSGKAGWRNQSGNKFVLSDLKGKPVVLTMFFANCTYACPILVNDMKKIEASLPKEKLPSYKFVLISIDPDRDTPRSLNEFAKKNNLDTKHWTLLAGTKDDVMELAALIGFKYKKDGKGDFSHSNLITFLNEEGEIVHQQVGLNQDATESVNLLSKLN